MTGYPGEEKMQLPLRGLAMAVEMLEIIQMVAPAAGLVGVLGWSHKSINDRVNKIMKEQSQKPTEVEVRQLIKDKLAPVSVGMGSISRRIEDTREVVRQLDNKLDRILEILRSNQSHNG